jgi:hypothetical protein
MSSLQKLETNTNNEITAVAAAAGAVPPNGLLLM